MKNYKIGIILGIIAIVSTLLIVGVPIGDKVYAIGFLPGMIISIIGLVLIHKNKEKYSIVASYVLNILALILSILSLSSALVINHGFIIQNVQEINEKEVVSIVDDKKEDQVIENANKKVAVVCFSASTTKDDIKNWIDSLNISNN